MPHKASGGCFPSSPSSPPHHHTPPPHRRKVRTVCQSREREADLTGNKSHLSNHLVLSPPDRREERCVSAENGALKSWLPGLTLLFSQCVTLLDLHLPNRNLLPRRDYVSVRNISACCIKSGVKGQRGVSAAKGTSH